MALLVLMSEVDEIHTFDTTVAGLRASILEFDSTEADQARFLAGEAGPDLFDALYVGSQAVKHGYAAIEHEHVSAISRMSAAAVRNFSAHSVEVSPNRDFGMCADSEVRFLETLDQWRSAPLREDEPKLTLHVEGGKTVAVTKHFGEQATLVLRQPKESPLRPGMLLIAMMYEEPQPTAIAGIEVTNFDPTDYAFMRFTTFAFPRSYTSKYSPLDVNKKLAKYVPKVAGTRIRDIRKQVDQIAEEALSGGRMH